MKLIRFFLKLTFYIILLIIFSSVFVYVYPKKTMKFFTDKFSPSIKYNFDNIFFCKNGVAINNSSVFYENMPGTTVELNHISVLLNPVTNKFANFDINIDGGKFISDLNYRDQSIRVAEKNINKNKSKINNNNSIDFKINVTITNFYLSAKKIKLEDLSGTVIISSNEITAILSGKNFFDGKTFLTFKKKNKKLSFEIELKSLDANEFCNVFALKKNYLTGNFSGFIKTVINDGNIESLTGKLQSDGSGKLYFSEAEKYIGAMQEGMNKELIMIMVKQLKNYDYLNCEVDFSYILKEKSTLIVFDFDGEISDYRFPIYYHATWLDALKLISNFNY